MRGHDVVIKTDGEDVPLMKGVAIDGHELIVPSDATVEVGADSHGLMTVTFTVLARSIHTSDGAE